ncbi:DUF4287 domain-containing protein [Pseudoxanthomonas sp. CCNWLW206]
MRTAHAAATTETATRQPSRITMSFQAYLDNIQTKTGKSPADFRKLAATKGFTENGGLKAGIKAGDIIAWLKKDFGLGHGHSIAIVALLKGAKKED